VTRLKLSCFAIAESMVGAMPGIVQMFVAARRSAR
jgi:hypothetical protein